MYVKNGDLPNKTGRNTHLELCQMVNHIVADQLVKGVWSMATCGLECFGLEKAFDTVDHQILQKTIFVWNQR